MKSTTQFSQDIGDDVSPSDLEGDEDLEPEYDDFVPTLDSNGGSLESGERLVTYVDRGPLDVVISGPVVGGWGPGRFHRSRRAAFSFLVEKYGAGRVSATRQSSGRWSFLIRNLKAKVDK
jgi:hypothetical protein